MRKRREGGEWGEMERGREGERERGREVERERERERQSIEAHRRGWGIWEGNYRTPSGKFQNTC